MTRIVLNQPGEFNGDMRVANANWVAAFFLRGTGAVHIVSQTSTKMVVEAYGANPYVGYTVELTPVTQFSMATAPWEIVRGAVKQLVLKDPSGAVVSTVDDFSPSPVYVSIGNVVLGSDTQIIGSDGADVLYNHSVEPIYGPVKAHLVDGGAGNDVIYGGQLTDGYNDYYAYYYPPGYDVYDDTLIGGAGDDTIYARGGDDHILAGDGADYVDAGAGTDVVDLGEAKTHITVWLDQAGSGGIHINGAEQIVLGDFGTTLWGGAGIDTVIGGLGADEVHGGDGDDLISGLDGDDHLVGDAGDDLLDGGKGDDVLDGGDGSDTVDLSAASAGLVIDLHLTTAQDTGQGRDTFLGVENLYGGAYADRLTGNDVANLLHGGKGADVLAGGAGDDVLDGGAGKDTAVFDYGFADVAVLDKGPTSVVFQGLDGIETDTVRNVEVYRFADGQIDIADGYGLVDDLAYFDANRDVYRAGLDAELHYSNYGWKEGRDPDFLFTTTGYLAAYADVAAAGINPLEHYRNYGFKEGRDPNDNFDSEQYLARNADVAAAGINPLEHYLNYGRAEGRQIYAAVGRSVVEGFDAEYYLLAYNDVARAGMDPLAHYLTYGINEGRNPNAYFDTSYYLEHNLDVAAAGIDPLAHYWEYGWKEGRDPSAHFDSSAYLLWNGDVAAAGLNPLEHYLEYGRLENRVVHDAGWVI